jgi:RNA polymerase sigma-32 factor
MNNWRMVKIGTTNERRKILMNLNREKRELEAKGITPTAQILAANLGVEEQEILDVEQAMAGTDVSLDTPIGNNDGNMRFKDTLQVMEESVDERIAQGEFREMLEKKFALLSETLSEREQVILQRRLMADEPETLQQIADLYGISREAVRVAERKLIAKIKKYMVESFRDVQEIEFNLR